MADYIRKSKAIERLAALERLNRNSTLATARRIINIMPDEEAEQVRHGVWLPIPESRISGWNPEFAGRDPIGAYVCSVCQQEALYSCNDEFVLSNYCPNCGAMMDGREENS